MKFQDIKTCIVEQFKTSNRSIPYIKGAPGGGKSALALEIGKEGEALFGKPWDHVIVFNASLREPTDLLGLPNVHGEVARWLPPEELSACATGRNLLIVEELGDAAVPMQNALSGLFELRVNNLQLSDETFIIATGNKTEHKSGAHRMTTKLANRLRHYEFDTNLDDWCDWALDKGGIDIMMVQFLRFKPGMLHDFDANRELNPSPRSWDKANLVPETLDPLLFMESVAGDVGPGAAAEYTAFRKIAASLPSIDSLLLNPATADVPTDPAVLFAMTGALTMRTNKDNIDRVTEFTNRMPVDFNVLFMNDTVKLKPEVKQTKAFVRWAVSHATVLM